MRVVRYADTEGRAAWGCEEADGSVTVLDGTAGAWIRTDRRVEVHHLLAPVQPPVIYAVGLNYKAHAEEGGKDLPQQPMIFMKAVTAVQDPGGAIELPRHLRSDAVDYEAELAIVIGRTCRNVAAADALDVILGYTCANDVSARDWQLRWGGGQYCRGKTFDTFCPLGPALVTTDELGDAGNLRICTRVNGDLRQDSSTSDMIFPVAELVEFLSGSTTLPAGTVILTGTPAGVGGSRKPPLYLQAGDRVEVEIERIGVLANPVIEEEL